MQARVAGGADAAAGALGDDGAARRPGEQLRVPGALLALQHLLLVPAGGQDIVNFEF